MSSDRLRTLTFLCNQVKKSRIPITLCLAKPNVYLLVIYYATMLFSPNDCLTKLSSYILFMLLNDILYWLLSYRLGYKRRLI